MRLPNDTQRISIVGATGSGKTVAACWHLSQRSYTSMPWIIYDWKTDDTINQIEGAFSLGVNDPAPTQAGLYIVHPLPDETEAVEAQMWSVWGQGNTGIYIDEGYMVGNKNKAFRALLTQGRSKRVPMIILAQRPVWMDRFVFSESEFFQIFRLQHTKDVKAVQEYIPQETGNISKRLPEYYSYYYDVPRNRVQICSPVPSVDIILDTFDARLATMPKMV